VSLAKQPPFSKFDAGDHLKQQNRLRYKQKLGINAQSDKTACNHNDNIDITTAFADLINHDSLSRLEHRYFTVNP